MLQTRTWPQAPLMWVALGFAFVAPVPSRSSAQQAAGATPELIDAILRHTYRFEGGNVRLLAGRVPDDLGPNFYVPPGARVLGSVVMGSSVRVFATSEDIPVDSLRALYTRALEPAGWKPFTWQTHGGFAAPRRDAPLMFCRDGAQLHIQQRHRNGSSDLVLDYLDGTDRCDRPTSGTRQAIVSSRVGVSAAQAMPPSEPRFPTLYAPDDVGGSARVRCFSSGGAYHGLMRTSTMLPATMSASELLAHYGKQLEAVGWRPARKARREAAAASWTLTDTSGVTELNLQVVETGTAGARCFDVQMGVSSR